MEGGVKLDHSGLGEVCYDIRGEKSKFCMKMIFSSLLTTQVALFMVDMIYFTCDLEKIIFFHTRLAKYL